MPCRMGRRCWWLGKSMSLIIRKQKTTETLASFCRRFFSHPRWRRTTHFYHIRWPPQVNITHIYQAHDRDILHFSSRAALLLRSLFRIDDDATFDLSLPLPCIFGTSKP